MLSILVDLDRFPMALLVVFHVPFMFPLEDKIFLSKNSFFDLVFKEVTLLRTNQVDDAFSGIPSGYARNSVNTLGYQTSIFVQKLIPLKPKI